MIEVDYDDPHPRRARRILLAKPEVRSLFGRNPRTAFVAAGVVGAQLGIAWLVSDAAWWVAVLAAWLVGAFLAHAGFALIHEACHDLVFRSRTANKALMLFVNAPLVAPFAIGLGHWHLLHHRRQGQTGLDPDLPSQWEVTLFRGRSGKLAWHLLFPLVEALRTLGRDDGPKVTEPWMLANLVVQVVATALIALTLGWTAVLYLAASLYFVFALHPLFGRFIQEHTVFEPVPRAEHRDPARPARNGGWADPVETSSYYGVLSPLALHFGHHVEHHDFPAIPWNRLPRLRRMAPDAYAFGHRSWGVLWLRFLLDPGIQLSDRVVRAPRRRRRPEPVRNPKAEAAARA